MRNLSCVVLCIVLSSALVRAQSGPAGGFHLSHQSDIRALGHAGDDRLWVGTTGGLVIYDLGNDRVVDRVVIGESLPSSDVRAIATKEGRVYVGTEGGLSVFGPDGEASVHTPSRPNGFTRVPLRRIRAIDFGLGGQLFLGTFGGGVGIIHPDSIRALTRADSLLDNKVFDIVQEDDSTFYYATSMGLCAFRRGAWVSFQAGAGLPRGEVRRMIARETGGYYILVAGRGVYTFNRDRARNILQAGLFAEDDVADITLDSDGRLWACGRYGGIGIYQNGQWAPVASDDPVIGQAPWRCAYTDDAGDCFFGAGDGLIVAVRHNVLKRFRLTTELESGSVGDVVTSPEGKVFFLDGANLVRIMPDGTDMVREGGASQLAALAVSPGGQVWASGRWGLYRLTPGGLVSVPVAGGEQRPYFSALTFDRRGNLWVGSRAGFVYRFDGEIWLRMADPTELMDGSIDALAADSTAGVWAMSRHAGVARFDGRRWHRFGIATFDSVAIRALTVSPGGEVAVATEYQVWSYTDSTGWHPAAAGSGEAAARWRDINDIGFDTDGRLFIAERRGLAIVGAGDVKWKTVLGGADVSAMVVGRDAVWLGFRKDGLTRLPLTGLQ